MNIKTFILKQQTPIIHFQADENGATLRASEVKPMLDRFLIKKAGGWQQVNPLWKIKNKEGKALNYKMSIEASGNTYNGEIQPIEYEGEYIKKKHGKISTKQYPCFFGNTGKKDFNGLKWFRWCSFLSVKIITPQSTLLDFLSANFHEFIFYNNFGCRSGKGFGSFTVFHNNNDLLPYLLPNYHFNIECPQNSINGLKKRYSEFYKAFELKDEELNFLLQIKELFSYIDLLYKALRSGINIPEDRNDKCNNNSRFYFKSLLFNYFKSKGIQWEKKTIKEHFYATTNPNDCLSKQKVINKDPESAVNYEDRLPKDHKKLIRDVLGLSTLQEWITYEDSLSKESIEKINDVPKYARFKSPIMFKPIRIGTDSYRVYIEPGVFPNELRGKKFKVQSKYFKKSGALSLTFPDDFEMHDFFSYLFDRRPDGQFNINSLEEYVHNDAFINQPEFTKLSSMINQLRGENHD